MIATDQEFMVSPIYLHTLSRHPVVYQETMMMDTDRVIIALSPHHVEEEESVIIVEIHVVICVVIREIFAVIFEVILVVIYAIFVGIYE